MHNYWKEAKEKIKKAISSNSFNLWINPISFLRANNGTLILGCPNKFARNWVMENYKDLIEEKLKEVGAGSSRVLFDVKPLERKKKGASNVFDEPRQLVLPNLPGQGRMRRGWLNSALTFDRFVVGKCNEFAYSVSKAMAFEEIQNHTPLFMLANTGLGKSHLTHAIGHAILNNRPTTKVFYTTVENFINEMIFGLKNNQIDQFKNKYRRSCDVLLLEDVHFLSGKDKTQLELEHTLDALINENKKIIFTSPLLPRDIPNMTKEIASRLTSGIITTLDKPDYTTRVKILEKKSFELNLVLSDDITHLLAKYLTRDIRQIESALACLKAKSALLKAKITKDLAMEVVRCHISENGSISIEYIQRLLSRYFKIDFAMLASKSRKKIHTYPRNIYTYLCRNYTDATLEDIGRSINRNHSTVLYASEVVAHKMKIDQKMKKQVNFLCERLEEKMK